MNNWQIALVSLIGAVLFLSLIPEFADMDCRNNAPVGKACYFGYDEVPSGSIVSKFPSCHCVSLGEPCSYWHRADACEALEKAGGRG